MSARRQILFAASLALFGAACTESTAPPLEVRATVAVPSSLALTRSAGSNSQWIQFTLPVTITNTASVPLTFDFCGSIIEVQNAAVWTSIYAPYCMLSTEPRLAIAPGETRTVSLPVIAAVGGNGGPMWGDGSVRGTYRLQAALLPDGFSGITRQIPSNAFTLLDGQ